MHALAALPDAPDADPSAPPPPFASAGADGAVRLWAAGALAACLSGHRRAVHALAVLPAAAEAAAADADADAASGPLLVSASADRTLRTWAPLGDPAAARCRAVLDGHSAPVLALAALRACATATAAGAASASAALLSAAADGELRLWLPREGVCLRAVRRCAAACAPPRRRDASHRA